MRTTLVFLTAAALSGADAPSPRAGNPSITHCLVSLIHDIKVPAQEAGVLVELAPDEGVQAREGLHVEKDTLLARINDSKAQMAKKVAVSEQKVAHEQAENEARVEYAKLASKVARSDYQIHKDANKKSPNSTPVAEMEKLWLTFQRSGAEIDLAEMEQEVARLTYDAKTAAVEAADDDIKMRRITAPIRGEVIEVYRHVGEWVNPGDDVARVVQLDRLRIEGFLNIAAFAPSEVIGRSVKVRVKLAHGEETFEGEIVFVKPLVEADGTVRVWAEVDNRKRNGQWLLLPGHEAEMTINIEAAAARSARPRR